MTVDVARSLDVPEMILLVNKALPKLDRADIKARFEAEFDAPVAGFMPLTFDLAENASKDLFSLSRPEHEWSLALREVAGAVLAMK